MSRSIGLTLVVLFASLSGVSAQQPVQPAPAQPAPAQPASAPVQTPAAVETDPDYILDAAFSLGTYRLGPSIVSPSMIREVKPAYTADAIRRRVEGKVTVSIRIGADGTVEAVRVRKSLDRGGLDIEAMRAARQWLFKPATLNGAPVPVMADLVLSFSLDDKPPAAAQ